MKLLKNNSDLILGIITILAAIIFVAEPTTVTSSCFGVLLGMVIGQTIDKLRNK